jgi:Ca-activated chloride channel family protein
MNWHDFHPPFQCTHPYYLWLLPVALAWVVWLSWKTDVQVSKWRRWTALGIRGVIVIALVLALAGLQWLRPLEGMNVFFLLDRSDSIPSGQQEMARAYVNQSTAKKQKVDKGGVIVFGTEANIETTANAAVDVEKIQAVVGTERTDVAGAVRLGTAAFPESGQKRLVLMSDGNENIGDAMAAVLAARPLGVTVDVVPMGVARGNDVSVQKLGVPPKLKKGQVFETKIFIQSDKAQTATVSLNRNDQSMGRTKVELSPGKNLFTFPQTLGEPGFYKYDVTVEAEGDSVPQNNRASAFANVKGDPRVLVVSSDPDADKTLVAALRTTKLDVRPVGLTAFRTRWRKCRVMTRFSSATWRPGISAWTGKSFWKARCGILASGWSAWAGTRRMRRGDIAGRRWRPHCHSTWNWTARRCCPAARWRW